MTTTSAQPAIMATGLRKSFGDLVVLDGLDLHVPQATVFSLLGANGAGLRPRHPPVPGQQLARVEMRVAFPALLTRFPTLRLAIPPEKVPLRTNNMDIYGVHRLPVTWDEA